MGKAKGSVRRMYPGGNTSQGFYSYYDYILDQKEAARMTCIKGGPGVGKSSFMKRIGVAMVDKGFDAEYHHCSSDNHSIDGVLFPQIGVALIDGTAPHVVDPKNPGAVDEILHLGDFWKEDGMRANKRQILENNALVGKLFARAYQYLAAAKCIYDDMVVIHQEATNAAGVYLELEKIVAAEFAAWPISDKMGKVRKLFASAITPGGLCNYLETIISSHKNIYIIKGAAGTGTQVLLSKVVEHAVRRGFDAEAYYCPMEPEHKVEHVVIPKLSLAFTTSNKYHSVDINTDKVVDLNGYIHKAVLEKHKDALKYDVETFDAILDKAVATIKKAKETHDVLETFYIPNMKFDEVQVCWEKTLARILAYAEEVS